MDISRTFRAPEPVTLDVRNSSGKVTVTASDTDEARIEVRSRERDVEKTRIEFDGARLVVHTPDRRFIGIRLSGYDVRVSLPTGSSVEAKVASADVTVHGRIDSLHVSSASGNVAAEDIDGEATVRTASGNVTLGAVTGEVRANSASGRIRIACAETIEVKTASGDVVVSELGGSGTATSASGGITVERAGQGTLELTAVSGNVLAGVAHGTAAHLALRSLSGRVASELPVNDEPPTDGATLDIRARTVSGNITVARAAAGHVGRQA